MRLEALEGRLAPAVHVWTGGGTTNNWSDAGNWSGGTPTGDSAAVLLFSGTQQTTNTNDLTGLTIQSITFSDPFTISGNAVTLTGDITTSGSLSGSVSFSPSIVLSGSPVIAVSNSSAVLDLRGVLSGDSGFTKNGDGSLLVEQAGSYTGTTTLTAGTLNPRGSSLGTGTVALDGGTLQLTANFTNPFTVGDPSHQGILATISSPGGIHITGNGTLSQYGTLLINFPHSTHLDGNLSGSGAMIIAGAGAIVDGDNSGYSGTVTVNDGGVQVGSVSALGTGLLILNNGTLVPTVAVTLANPYVVYTGTIAGDQNISLTGAGFLARGALYVENTAGTVSLGSLSGPGSLGRIPAYGMAGTLLLTAACTYSGSTAVEMGILQLGVPNALPSTTGVVMYAGGTLDLDNQDATVSYLTGAAGSVTLGTGTLTTGGAGVTFGGSISGSGGLVKTGFGTLTLSGANTYTGATIVNGGTLRLGAANALSSSTAVSMTSGATLDLNNNNATLASVAGAGNVTLGAGTLTTGGANASTTLSGSISGTGGLTKTGSGTFTLANINAFTGRTTVNAGTLLLAHDNALVTTSALTVNAAGTLDFSSGADILSTSLTGAGTVLFGGSPVTIQGTYAVTGSTSITAGTVLFNSATPGTMQTLLINGGSLQVQASTNLNATTATLRGGELGGAGTFTVVNNGHLYWYAGTMDGIGGMTMIMAGSTLNVLGSGDHYQNQRQVCNAGNVIWGGSGGIWWTGSGAMIRNERGGGFDFAADTNARFGFNSGGASFTNDAGAVFQRSNTGTTTFDAGVTFSNSGTVDVRSGTLALGGGSSDSAAVFTVEAGATLNFAGGTFTASAIAGAGAVTFSAGTTTVGAYTVSGPTSVAGGAVTFTQGFSLASLAVSNGSLAGMAAMTVSQTFTWSGGTLLGPGAMTVQSAAQLNLSGSGDKTLDGCALSLAGTATWSGTGGLDLRDGVTLSIQSGGVLDAQSDASINGLGGSGASTFINNDGGTFRKSGGAGGTSATVVSVPFTNNGTIDLQAGTLQIAGLFRNFSFGTLSGGTYLIAGLFQFNQAAIQTNAAQVTLNGPAAQISDIQSGNDALASLNTNAFGGGFSLQNGASYTTSDGFYNAGTLTLGAGSALAVSGDFTQDPAGTLSLQFGGPPGSGLFGQLAVAGTANLDGTLTASLVNPPFMPNPGDSYTVLTFAARNGDFATENLDLGGGLQFVPSYDAVSLTLTATSVGGRHQGRFFESVAEAPAPRIGDQISVTPLDRISGLHGEVTGIGNTEVAAGASPEDIDALFALPRHDVPADDAAGGLLGGALDGPVAPLRG